MTLPQKHDTHRQTIGRYSLTLELIVSIWTHFMYLKFNSAKCTIAYAWYCWPLRCYCQFVKCLTPHTCTRTAPHICGHVSHKTSISARKDYQLHWNRFEHTLDSIRSHPHHTHTPNVVINPMSTLSAHTQACDLSREWLLYEYREQLYVFVAGQWFLARCAQ